VYYVIDCTICSEVFLQIQYGSVAHYVTSLIVAARISYKRDGSNRYLRCSRTTDALQPMAVRRTKLPVVRNNWASGGEIEEANELQRNVFDYSSTKTFSFPLHKHVHNLSSRRSYVCLLVSKHHASGITR